MEDGGRGGKKLGLIMKTWERCKSLGGFRRNRTIKPSVFAAKKSKSWSHMERSGSGKRGGAAAPQGWLWVYVGEERQRFVIKTKQVNHPMFRELLEEAESEFGYRSDGPLIFPCEVNRFLRVLGEMESDYGDPICGGGFGRFRYHSSYHLLTPPR